MNGTQPSWPGWSNQLGFVPYPTLPQGEITDEVRRKFVEDVIRANASQPSYNGFRLHSLPVIRSDVGVFAAPAAWVQTGTQSQLNTLMSGRQLLVKVYDNINFTIDMSPPVYPQLPYRWNTAAWSEQGLGDFVARGWSGLDRNSVSCYFGVCGVVYSQVSDPYSKSVDLVKGSAAQDVPALPPLEQADILMRLGRADKAEPLLRSQLSSDGLNASVQRMLGLSLLDQRRYSEAAAEIYAAYFTNPQLASSPVDPAWMVGGPMEHRNRFLAMQDHANRTRSVASLFAAVVLAQSDGRPEVARRLLDRASKMGLDTQIEGSMRKALARKP